MIRAARGRGHAVALITSHEHRVTSHFNKEKAMATIRITDLHLRAIIGANDWERTAKQDILINITMEFDAGKAAQSDDLRDTVDYKTLTKKIIGFVEGSKFFLLEKLTDQVLKLVMKDKRVLAATVRIDKPTALRFAKSVSVELSSKR